MRAFTAMTALLGASASSPKLNFESAVGDNYHIHYAADVANNMVMGAANTCTKIDGGTECIGTLLTSVQDRLGVLEGKVDALTPTAGWVKLLTNAAYHGATNGAAYNPENFGSFSRVKAVWRSGCVACSMSSAARDSWQCCGSASGHGTGTVSFELKKNNAYYVEQTTDWFTLPNECTKGAADNADIVCQKPLTLTAGDTLMPTWQEPSHSTSTGDNGRTVAFDLYGFVDSAPVSGEWVQLLADAEYHGASNPQPTAPMAQGTFTETRAVWKSGCVACSMSSAARDSWQCCGSASGHGTGTVSFELKKNDAYLFEQTTGWNTLPNECTKDSADNADIFCTKEFNLANGDFLTPTWQEPSHSTSTSDNGRTVTFDLWARRK
jgi:hypothetical protein